MKTRLATAALALSITCIGTTGARAFVFTFGGSVTSAVNGNGIDTSSFVGQPISIVVSGGGWPYEVGSPETDLTPAFSEARISIGDTTTLYWAIYFEPSYIRNDGVNSSLSVHFGDTFVSFGPLNGQDGNLDMDAWSSRPNMPLDPERSFGPISVQGRGTFSASPYVPYDQDPAGGYLISFDIDSLSGVGSISAVPLPASLQLLGGALFGLGVVGCGLKRRSQPQAA